MAKLGNQAQLPEPSPQDTLRPPAASGDSVHGDSAPRAFTGADQGGALCLAHMPIPDAQEEGRSSA